MPFKTINRKFTTKLYMQQYESAMLPIPISEKQSQLIHLDNPKPTKRLGPKSFATNKPTTKLNAKNTTLMNSQSTNLSIEKKKKKTKNKELTIDEIRKHNRDIDNKISDLFLDTENLTREQAIEQADALEQHRIPLDDDANSETTQDDDSNIDINNLTDDVKYDNYLIEAKFATYPNNMMILAKAIKLQPTRHEAYLQYAHFQYDQGDYHEVKKALYAFRTRFDECDKLYKLADQPPSEKLLAYTQLQKQNVCEYVLPQLNEEPLALDVSDEAKAPAHTENPCFYEALATVLDRKIVDLQLDMLTFTNNFDPGVDTRRSVQSLSNGCYRNVVLSSLVFTQSIYIIFKKAVLFVKNALAKTNIVIRFLGDPDSDYLGHWEPIRRPTTELDIWQEQYGMTCYSNQVSEHTNDSKVKLDHIYELSIPIEQANHLNTEPLISPLTLTVDATQSITCVLPQSSDPLPIIDKLTERIDKPNDFIKVEEIPPIAETIPILTNERDTNPHVHNPKLKLESSEMITFKNNKQFPFHYQYLPPKQHNATFHYNFEDIKMPLTNSDINVPSANDIRDMFLNTPLDNYPSFYLPYMKPQTSQRSNILGLTMAFLSEPYDSSPYFDSQVYPYLDNRQISTPRITSLPPFNYDFKNFQRFNDIILSRASFINSVAVPIHDVTQCPIPLVRRIGLSLLFGLNIMIVNSDFSASWLTRTCKTGFTLFLLLTDSTIRPICPDQQTIRNYYSGHGLTAISEPTYTSEQYTTIIDMKFDHNSSTVNQLRYNLPIPSFNRKSVLFEFDAWLSNCILPVKTNVNVPPHLDQEVSLSEIQSSTYNSGLIAPIRNDLLNNGGLYVIDPSMPVLVSNFESSTRNTLVNFPSERLRHSLPYFGSSTATTLHREMYTSPLRKTPRVIEYIKMNTVEPIILVCYSSPYYIPSFMLPIIAYNLTTSEVVSYGLTGSPLSISSVLERIPSLSPSTKAITACVTNNTTKFDIMFPFPDYCLFNQSPVCHAHQDKSELRFSPTAGDISYKTSCTPIISPSYDHEMNMITLPCGISCPGSSGVLHQHKCLLSLYGLSDLDPKRLTYQCFKCGKSYLLRHQAIICHS